MSRPGIAYRGPDARLTPLWAPLDDRNREVEAQLGSKALLAATGNNVPQSIPTGSLTHAEQIAAVLSGRARIVTVGRICKADPEYTLGGVQPW